MRHCVKSAQSSVLVRALEPVFTIHCRCVHAIRSAVDEAVTFKLASWASLRRQLPPSEVASMEFQAVPEGKQGRAPRRSCARPSGWSASAMRVWYHWGEVKIGRPPRWTNMNSRTSLRNCDSAPT